jgi:hypothetical protein
MEKLETLEDVLRNQRNKYLARLIELVGYDRPEQDAIRLRIEAKAILLELSKLDQARPLIQAKYSGQRKTSHAIADFLKEINRPATIEEIKEGVRARGFLGGTKASDRSVINCVNNFDRGTGSRGKKAKIKVVGSMVGLKEWPDSIF